MKSFALKVGLQNRFDYLPFLTRVFGCTEFQKPVAASQVLVESFTNAVKHGSRRSHRNRITVEILAAPHSAMIRVTDSGKGFPKKMWQKKVGRWATEGRGLLLIRSLSKRVILRKHLLKHTLEAHLEA